MDRFEAMKTFSVVAEHESFAEAARRLRISPSTASRTVAALEEELGVTLLNRTTRVVRLTALGAVYLDHCKQILEDVTNAERLVRGERATPRGMLSITAPVCFGRLAVLPIVQRLMQEHSALAVRMTLLDRVVDLIEEGIDLGVRIGPLADSALVGTKVGETRRVVVAARDYLERYGAPRTPADLKRHRVIVFESIEGTRDWRFGTDGRASVRVDASLIVNNVDAAIGAAMAGLGLTRVLCYQVKDAVAAGRLTLLLEDVAPPAVPVTLVRPGRRSESSNVRAFIEAARSEFINRPIGIPSSM